jgi:MFS family permease
VSEISQGADGKAPPGAAAPRNGTAENDAWPSRGSAAALGALLVAPFLAQLDATIANVATPSIQAGLHASGAAAQLVIGGYLIAYAVLLITGARLGQVFGYKRLFLSGIAAFGLFSLLAGLAPTAAVLIAARVAQGAAAAMMYPQSLTGIQLTFSGPARAPAFRRCDPGLVCGSVV